MLRPLIRCKAKERGEERERVEELEIERTNMRQGTNIKMCSEGLSALSPATYYKATSCWN